MGLFRQYSLLLRAIEEEIRRGCEVGAQGVVHFRRQGGFLECVGHELHPAVAGGLVDREGGVAHAQAGVSALFDVAGGAAEAGDEEVAEADFGSGQILGGVEGTEEGVRGDLAVEGSDQAGEAFFSDDLVNVLFLHEGLGALGRLA